MKKFHVHSRSLLLNAAALAGAVLGSNVHAQLLYSTPGSTLTENFNALPTDAPNNATLQGTGAGLYVNGWQDNSTTVAGDHIGLPGWYLYHPTTPSGTEIGSNGHQRFRMGNGSNTGAFWGFGSGSADSEKALGAIGSNTIAPNDTSTYMALRLVNNTGQTLHQFTLTFDGEQWRDGQSASPETLAFAYSATAGAADWFDPNASFTAVASLNFTSPVFSGTGSSGAAVDGNTAGLTPNISATVTGLTWAPNAELWLRWSDNQLAGNSDDGLAIDNLRFSATPVPEPASVAFWAALGLGIFGYYRRSRRLS